VTQTPPAAPETVADLLRARAGDDAPGVLFGDRSWTWRQVVSESDRRAAMATRLRRPGPFHIGVLLDNLPDYLFWLGGAALTGATVVGINPTRRGEELARDIRFADCQLVVTDAAGADLLEGLDLGLPPDRLLHIESGGDGSPTAAGADSRVRNPDPVEVASAEVASAEVASAGVVPSDLFLLPRIHRLTPSD